MPEVQKTGDEKSLGMKSSSQVPSGRGGLGKAGAIGESINLSHTPTPFAFPLGTDGRVESVAETVTLGTTPIHGLGSAATIPMSERAVDQSKTGR